MFYSDSHVNNKLAVSEAPLNSDFCLLIDGDKHYTLNKTQRKQFRMTSWSCTVQRGKEGSDQESLMSCRVNVGLPDYYLDSLHIILNICNTW